MAQFIRSAGKAAPHLFLAVLVVVLLYSSRVSVFSQSKGAVRSDEILAALEQARSDSAAQRDDLAEQAYGDICARVPGTNYTLQSLKRLALVLEQEPDVASALDSLIRIIYSQVELNDVAAAGASLGDLVAEYHDHEAYPSRIDSLFHFLYELPDFTWAETLGQIVLEGDLNLATGVWGARHAILVKIYEEGGVGVTWDLFSFASRFLDATERALSWYFAAKRLSLEGRNLIEDGYAVAGYSYLRTATGLWERMIRNFPDAEETPLACRLLADSYCRLGEHIRAIELYQFVAEQWPEAWFAQDATIRVALTLEKLQRPDVQQRIRKKYAQVLAAGQVPDDPERLPDRFTSPAVTAPNAMTTKLAQIIKNGDVDLAAVYRFSQQTYLDTLENDPNSRWAQLARQWID